MARRNSFIGFKWEIDQASQRRLARLVTAVATGKRGQLARRVLPKVMKPVWQAARQATPRNSGLLKRSMGASQVRVYRNSGIAFIAAGPRRNFGQVVVTKIRKGKKTYKYSRKQVPTKYFHLVEKGFRHTGGKTIPAKHPLQRAFTSSKARMLQILFTETRNEIAKIVAKEKNSK